jgi:hypothetical protein
MKYKISNKNRVQSVIKKLRLDKPRPRIVVGGLAALMIFSITSDVLVNFVDKSRYELTAQAESLLREVQPKYTPLFEYNGEENVIEYNKGYKPGGDIAGQTSNSKFSARFFNDPKKGIEVVDAVNEVSATFKPKFKLGEPEQKENRVMYPLLGKEGVKVVSIGANGYKEDIILEQFVKNELDFKYEMSLPEGTEARLESDGSLGIYGVTPELLGDVSTGSIEDQALLKKARDAGEKNQLLFSSPAPFIIESNKGKSEAKARYSLEGNILTLHAEQLEQATYPISVDPSIFINTATRLMRGNNETNLDFDVDNELVQKGETTGARFDSWASTMALPAARWNHGTAVAGGNIYVVGGNSGSAQVSSVYWAKFDTANYDIDSPNPGAGVCTNWCTDSAYDLPEARDGASLVAYNGFLYLFGGRNSSDVRQSTVYIAKLGVNGEPSLWHPTDPDQNNWDYWYSDTALSTERAFSAAAAYNNRMYLLGGQTTAAAGGVTTVEYANISPTGTLSTWSTTDMVALPSARHNHTIQVYNDRMYLIGGNSSGTLQNGVSFIKLDTDGTMEGNWTSTTAFGTARMGWGGNFSTIWGGYIYMAGGCTAINGSGFCTTIASDVQLASINADGTLTDWNTISGVTSQRMGYGFVGWRNTLYGIGGCTAHNTSTGACTTTSTLTQYGELNQDGDASTVSNSVDNTTAPCTGGTPYDCDLPPIGNGNGQGGRMSGMAIINNGYIYHIGGCRATGGGQVCYVGAGASRTADTISYSTINADGTLGRPACPVGTFYGSWCVDNTNTINGSTGVAASGHAIFNNVIYVIGGTNGTEWQSTVWRNPLNADGSLGSWSTQSFADLDLGAAKGYQYVFTRANPSSAGTYPGNLYVLGGCSGVSATDNGLDCAGAMYTEVYKCNITTTGALEEDDANDCTTSGQLQIDSEPNTSGSQGLGVMAGTVYANYIYLIGGQSPSELERSQIMYARIDNNNNIVAVTGSEWITSDNELDPARRRGVAFGYNGYLYALAGYADGSGLNDLLFAKVNVSDGSVGAFTTSQVTVNQRWDLRAVVNNGYVYTLGGCSVGEPPADCTTMSGTVQTFQLYNNYSGSPAAYTAGANLFATDRIGASSTVYNGYIYIAGGCTSATDCTLVTNNTQYASISSTGALGAWANTTDSTLPAVRGWGGLEVAGGTLYYMGGRASGGARARNIYYGTPNASGDIVSWNTSTISLPPTMERFGSTVWNNRIYVVGGENAVSPFYHNTVYVSPDLSAGGDITTAWTTSTPFNVGREGATAIAYANNLYVMGGSDGTNYLSDVQYAPLGYKTGTISQSGTTVTGSGTTWTAAMVGSTIQYVDGSKATITARASNTSITVDVSKTVTAGSSYVIQDGSVGAWSYTSSLPSALSGADGFAANGFMYLFGGRSDATTCPSNTFVAPISANTTIATGNNPTGVGEWYETNVRYSGDRYGAAAVYHEGKAYILGGGCGATLTYAGANRVVQTTLQSQPQVAKYSRMIDTDSDVFPTKWLMNGLDNSIGARWSLRYRTSTDANNEWGVDTDFGEVSLGTVEDYIPLDDLSVDTEFARFYYFNITIDSTQSYGYPDDVTRGPTIDDLTLFFVADPSKRLRHGKSFTGGEKQPLDTPPPD